MLCYAILYCTVLYYTILYYTIPYYTILYYTNVLTSFKCPSRTATASAIRSAIGGRATSTVHPIRIAGCYHHHHYYHCY